MADASARTGEPDRTAGDGDQPERTTDRSLLWCFVDESFQSGGSASVAVLAALLISDQAHFRLQRALYGIRKKYFGQDHARNLSRELKGKELLSRNIFKLAKKLGTMPHNQLVVREVLSYVGQLQEHYGETAHLLASVVWGRNPQLLCPDPRDLARPFRSLCERVALLAGERKVVLVFDQRLGEQEHISISIHNFLAGTAFSVIHPYPLLGVSNSNPGLQVADIAAYIIGQRALGNRDFLTWFGWLPAKASARDRGRVRHAIERFDEVGKNAFARRHRW